MRWDPFSEDNIEEEIRPLKILAIGCGGAGCNSIHRLNGLGLEGAETVAVNTDLRHLQVIQADKRLIIGREITRGLGAGGDPHTGMVCAYNASQPLNQILQGADLTFITVGMGGGTGTGAANVVAELAKRHGSLVVTIATTPFEFEGSRMQAASEGLRRIEPYSDTLLVVENDRLLDMVPNLPVKEAFAVMDMLISEIIRGLIEAITVPSLINLDFADLCSVLREGGISTLLYGENEDPQGVVEDAFNNPLLDIGLDGAKGALIHITGGPSMTLRKVNKVIKGITEHFDPDANIICGARVEEDCGRNIKVMAVVTGIAEMEEEEELQDSLVSYDR
ncbi:MAG: cell division protein FtsZ [Methanomassiliicoccales archaeon]